MARLRRMTAAFLALLAGFAADAGAASLSPADISPDQFHVRDGRFFADRQPVRFYGLNWSGLDTPDRALHGLWTPGALTRYMNWIRDAGFTAIRLPITPDMLDAETPVAEWAAKAGYGPNGLAMLNQAVDAAAHAGLWVILSFNSFDSSISGGDTPAPYDAKAGYSVEDWLIDLARIAAFARPRPEVAGIDLFNEPYGVSWKEWRELAGRAGRQVLAANHRPLIFVQGVGETDTDRGGYGAFWGSNLTEAKDNPIATEQIPAHKLVLSPHVYGPDVYMMPYFKKKAFPSNLPKIWDIHFGRLAGRYALCSGEFGGKYKAGGRDAKWQDAFVGYMQKRGGMADCWFYWQFAPTSKDTGGILKDDWQTLDRRKLDLLRRLKTR